jgi:hypothetical protein
LVLSFVSPCHRHEIAEPRFLSLNLLHHRTLLLSLWLHLQVEDDVYEGGYRMAKETMSFNRRGLELGRLLRSGGSDLDRIVCDVSAHLLDPKPTAPVSGVA